MSIPFTKPCPECEEDMELVTADEVGEIVVYECPECGYQEETLIEREDDDLEEPQPLDVSLLLDDDADDEPPTPDEPE